MHLLHPLEQNNPLLFTLHSKLELYAQVNQTLRSNCTIEALQDRDTQSSRSSSVRTEARYAYAPHSNSRSTVASVNVSVCKLYANRNRRARPAFTKARIRKWPSSVCVSSPPGNYTPVGPINRALFTAILYRMTHIFDASWVITFLCASQKAFSESYVGRWADLVLRAAHLPRKLSNIPWEVPLIGKYHSTQEHHLKNSINSMESIDRIKRIEKSHPEGSYPSRFNRFENTNVWIAAAGAPGGVRINLMGGGGWSAGIMGWPEGRSNPLC